MQRVLIVSNLFAPQHIGGAEVVAQRQARALAARGYHVAVMAGWRSDLGPPLEAADMSPDIPVYRLPVVSLLEDKDFFSPPAARFLQSVMAEERPDVVHFHNLRGLGVNLIETARAFGARTCVTLHDYWWQCRWATRMLPNGEECTRPDECHLACAAAKAEPVPARLRRDYILHSLELADVAIAPSRRLRDAVGLSTGRKIIHCSNGVDIERFQPAGRRTDGVVRFLAAGTLAPHKGAMDIIAAAAILRKDEALCGRWSLTIAGDGVLAGQMREAIAEAGLADHVDLVDPKPVASMPGLIQGHDVVLLASRWPENEPVVLLEAIASGKALLASTLGGGGLVDDGCNGALFPHADAAALAAAMASYVDAPAFAWAHGAVNALRRDRYSEAFAIDLLEEVYAAGKTDRRPARVVICAGAELAPLPDSLNVLLQAWERHGQPVRLIWSEWASAADWRDAVAVWNWDDTPLPEAHAAAASVKLVTVDDLEALTRD